MHVDPSFPSFTKLFGVSASVRRQNISDRGRSDLREYLAHLGGDSNCLLTGV